MGNRKTPVITFFSRACKHVMMLLLYECSDCDDIKHVAGHSATTSRVHETCSNVQTSCPGRTSGVARRYLPVSGGHVTSDELPWCNIWHVPLRTLGLTASVSTVPS